MSPEFRGGHSMSDSDIQREIEDSLCYNRNPLPPSEEDSPSKVAKFVIEGTEFHRDVSDDYPVCIGTYERVEVTDERVVRLTGYLDESKYGVQFGGIEDHDKMMQLEKLPLTPAKAKGYFIQSGETSTDPEIINRLENARKHRNSKRINLHITIQKP